MDINSIVQLVQNVGFPIACCVALFWQTNKLTAQHKEEVDALREALDRNTQIIARLDERLGGKIDD